MRHDWIFDVLADLRAYAEQNDLPALATYVAATLRVAELEIQAGGAGLRPRPDVLSAMGKAKQLRRPN